MSIMVVVLCANINYFVARKGMISWGHFKREILNYKVDNNICGFPEIHRNLINLNNRKWLKYVVEHKDNSLVSIAFLCFFLNIYIYFI